jgi:hypothetical protein
MADELDLIIQQLGLHPSATRIKKLMVYACRDRWESDAIALAAINWPPLIQQLRQLHSTPERLKVRLDILVGTLNKQADYWPVVNIIITALTPLYPQSAVPTLDDEIPTQIETTAQSLSAVNTLSELQAQFIQALAQEPDSDRIKKLLICAVRQYWETDSQKLATITIAELVLELQIHQPTLMALQTLLSQVVQNLSKPVEYRLVADTIVKHMRGLFIDVGACPVGRPDEIIADFEMTVPDPVPPTAPPVNQTVIQRARENMAGKLLDLFDLRLEVMKTTNPLRAKILLFSILYYDFNFQPQDWANLKLYSLDGLLRSVLKVCDTWDSLESNLRDVAQRQHDADAYDDVITAMLKCLKPAYTECQSYLQQVIKTVSVADATQVMRLNEATAIEISEDATEAGVSEDATLIEPPRVMTNWQQDEGAIAEPQTMTELLV